MTEVLKKIGELFCIAGEFYSYKEITKGNINSTYKVDYLREGFHIKSYLFQKINTFVFKNPEDIMDNIDKVTTFIRNKYPDQTTLHFHHTKERMNFCEYKGDYWRVSNFIDSDSYDITDDLNIIESTGEAFGHFQSQLSDFDGSLLHETIPNFHNTKKRLDTLFESAEKNESGRVRYVEPELEYINSVKDIASDLSIRYSNGEFSPRVTHNDTKANNVLFDRQSKKPIIVIDLDTVMPGMAMYDFGDAVRFIANTSTEDEPDLEKVTFDINKFKAFSKGFIGEIKNVFTEQEINSLVRATFSITIELAARFLDDFINRDKYFRCKFPAHNLVRTRCQLKLAKDMMQKKDEMKQIVYDIAHS